MEAITREEKIMSGENLTPITRKEMFLAKAAGQDVETPNPITREEIFLSKISGGGGSSVNVIPLSVTENGTYTAPSGTAYSPIDVNVASSGGESGENRLNQYLTKTLTEITEEDVAGVTSMAGSLFIDQIFLTSAIIPDGVKYIEPSTFYSCTRLESVTLPDTITGIGRSAFGSCTKLKNITIPKKVGSIGQMVFSGCSALRSVTIETETAPTLSNVSAFNNVPTSCIFYVKNLDSYNSTNWVAIRDQYTFIEIVEPSVGLAYTLNSDGASYAVSGIGTCTDLDIVIPDTYEGLSVTSIGSQAFSGCSKLTSVAIPNSVTSIGSGAFHNCASFTSINIPNGVTKIETGTFNGCSRVTDVTIPENVTSIGDYAFAYCYALANVTMESETPPTLASASFTKAPTNIYVPASSVEAYKSATNWSKYAEQIFAIE